MNQKWTITYFKIATVIFKNALLRCRSINVILHLKSHNQLSPQFMLYIVRKWIKRRVTKCRHFLCLLAKLCSYYDIRCALALGGFINTLKSSIIDYSCATYFDLLTQANVSRNKSGLRKQCYKKGKNICKCKYYK